MLAGRSLREVERQEDNVLFLTAAAWLAMIASLVVASVVVAWPWPG